MVSRSPMQTAMAHAFEHGMQVGACRRKPCRVGGLCWALYEILIWRAEREGARGAILGVAESYEHLLTVLATAIEPCARAVARLQTESRKQHKLEDRARLSAPVHAHALLCVEPPALVHALRLVQARLDRSRTALRDIIDSPQLRQSTLTKRSSLLLTAVYQHLAWGGLTYKEIFALVPDHSGPRGAKDRVRKRVYAKDARLPYAPPWRRRKRKNRAA